MSQLKNSFQKTGRFIINSNLWVSLAACGWAGMGQKLLGNFQWEWVVLIFGATYCAYHFQRFYAFAQLPKTDIASDRNQWYHKHANSLHTLALIWAIISAYCFLQLHLKWHLFILPLTLVFFYKVPLPFLGRNLRSLPFLKVFIITAVWTYVLAFVWMDTSLFQLHPKQIAFNVMTALIVFATSIPFDFRDRFSDRGELVSFPMVLSKKGVFIIIYLPYLIMSGLYLYFFSPDGLNVILLLLSHVFFIFLLRKMLYSEPKDVFYAWAFDGVILLDTFLML